MTDQKTNATRLQYLKQRDLKTILKLLFLSNNTLPTLPFFNLKLEQDEFILTELRSLAWLSQYSTKEH